MLRDEEFARMARGSINDLGRKYDCKFEGESALFEVRGRRYRVVHGSAEGFEGRSGESLFVLSWGDRPSGFVSFVDPSVTLFDLRFGTHSRRLDGFGTEFREALTLRGVRFGPIGSGPLKSPDRFSLRGVGRRLSRRREP